MMGALNLILNWLGGGVIDKVANSLVEARRDALNAKNDEDRIRAEVRVQQLEYQQNVLIAEQGSWMTRWIRPAFALPIAIYMGKVLLWDKVLGWGVTDDLSTTQWAIVGGIIGSYFLTRPFGKR